MCSSDLEGTFDYWTVLADPIPALERSAGAWLRAHLRGYSGFVNLETIGGTIIEAHLRFADQWVDLYGPGWLASLVDLYAHGRWDCADGAPRTGFSVVLFGRHGVRWTVDAGAVDELRRVAGVSSIQVTFHPDRPPDAHAMPRGVFRLAIVNCWDLAVGLLVRERLARLFRTPVRRVVHDLHPGYHATALARAMVIPTYWLAYHFQWTAPRFSIQEGGNVGPNVTPLVGYVLIPFGAAVVWILISLVVGGLLGSLVIKVKRKTPSKIAIA